MKNSILLILLFCVTRGFAQMYLNIDVMPNDKPNTAVSLQEVQARYKFSPGMIEKLKGTTLVYFYRKQEEKQLDEYKKAVSAAWNLTKIEFAPIEKYDTYVNKPGYSFFKPSYYLYKAYEGSRANGTVHSYQYQLLMNYPGIGMLKMGDADLKLDKKGPQLKGPKGILKTAFADEAQKLEQEFACGEAVFTNLTPVNMKLMLSHINKHLSEEKEIGGWDEVTDGTELKKLSQKTLYIPKYILGLTNFRGLVDGGENVSDQDAEEAKKKLFEKYPYKIEVVSKEELDKLILNAKEDVFFMYIEINNGMTSTNFIGIINAKNGGYAYFNKKKMLNLKQGHINDIVDAIKDAEKH